MSSPASPQLSISDAEVCLKFSQNFKTWFSNHQLISQLGTPALRCSRSITKIIICFDSCLVRLISPMIVWFPKFAPLISVTIFLISQICPFDLSNEFLISKICPFDFSNDFLISKICPFDFLFDTFDFQNVSVWFLKWAFDFRNLSVWFFKWFFDFQNLPLWFIKWYFDFRNLRLWFLKWHFWFPKCVRLISQMTLLISEICPFDFPNDTFDLQSEEIRLSRATSHFFNCRWSARPTTLLSELSICNSCKGQRRCFPWELYQPPYASIWCLSKVRFDGWDIQM